MVSLTRRAIHAVHRWGGKHSVPTAQHRFRPVGWKLWSSAPDWPAATAGNCGVVQAALEPPLDALERAYEDWNPAAAHFESAGTGARREAAPQSTRQALGSWIPPLLQLLGLLPPLARGPLGCGVGGRGLGGRRLSTLSFPLAFSIVTEAGHPASSVPACLGAVGQRRSRSFSTAAVPFMFWRLRGSERAQHEVKSTSSAGSHWLPSGA
ncbi:hypothetical protein ACCO45_007063 [Purpureocillium lilacinum]|uniref:Uncharacterized protein n=1 Tax=Purpureocillium lilacinum TaxID=33203 RepID=A0ACC4DU00_PURLI